MSKKKQATAKQKTPTGREISVRSREETMRDFRKIVAPVGKAPKAPKDREA